MSLLGKFAKITARENIDLYSIKKKIPNENVIPYLYRCNSCHFVFPPGGQIWGYIDIANLPPKFHSMMENQNGRQPQSPFSISMARTL